jgi:hypothetical protein
MPYTTQNQLRVAALEVATGQRRAFFTPKALAVYLSLSERTVRERCSATACSRPTESRAPDGSIPATSTPTSPPAGGRWLELRRLT